MVAINRYRVWMGGIAGGAVWTIWSFVVHVVVLGSRYPKAQEANLMLQQPRYPLFLAQWIVMLFLLSVVLAWLYAFVRVTLGPGPRIALAVGLLVGFAAGFPVNFTIASWFPLDRVFPLWWMLELWVGAVVATLVAAWLYRD